MNRILIAIVVAVAVAGIGFALDAWGDSRYAAGVASMQTKLDAAKADLTTCRGSLATLDKAVEGQNTAIRSQSAASTAALAISGAAVREAQKQTAQAASRVVTIMKPLAPGDVCARVLEVDWRLLEATR